MERKLEGCLFLKIDQHQQQQRMKTVEMKFVMLRIHVSTFLISDVVSSFFGKYMYADRHISQTWLMKKKEKSIGRRIQP